MTWTKNLDLRSPRELTAKLAETVANLNLSRTIRLFAGLWVALVIIVAVLAPILPLEDPLTISLTHQFQGPTINHLLGTDNVGRDTLSRLIWGSRPALVGAFLAILAATIISIPWGVASALGGALFDNLLMRLADGVLAFPQLILAITVAGLLGPSLDHTMLAIGIAFSPGLARIVRANILQTRDRDYSMISRQLGRSQLGATISHIIPNSIGPFIVQINILAGVALLAETGLNFLGLGVNPPAPSWGEMISTGYQYLSPHPELALIPGICVFLTVLSIFELGDALQDIVIRKSN